MCVNLVNFDPLIMNDKQQQQNRELFHGDDTKKILKKGLTQILHYIRHTTQQHNNLKNDKLSKNENHQKLVVLC